LTKSYGVEDVFITKQRMQNIVRRVLD